MAKLEAIVTWCNRHLNHAAIQDFPGAHNGLQVGNHGVVTKIGAAVDAGLVPFQKAVAANVDFLIVHHGLFWDAPWPLTATHYEKISLLLHHNCAVYSSHLPLDRHPQIGNNALITQKLGLTPIGTFLPYEGNDIGILTKGTESRTALNALLNRLFLNSVIAMEYGSDPPKKLGILSGSFNEILTELTSLGVDTLITGELRQRAFNQAQELRFNLYACGHYATEVFGVQALAETVAQQFDLPWEFLDTQCPL